jgi:hypothetical protein
MDMYLAMYNRPVEFMNMANKGCARDIKDLSKQAAAYGFIMS